MGTLTANDTRLPQYCDHKLPTSCRLSSIPNCCACADERAHAPSYSTYIDGVGFVPRGNRWQRYCWYCKEFWENRVEVSGLRPGQTKIPENPDQTEFMKRWYEFHRGYRIVINNEGLEERVVVVGEDFRQVSPGCLPRTLAELREGRRAEDVQEQTRVAPVEAQEPTGPSLEETLDSMFNIAADEERAYASSASTLTVQRLPLPNEPRVAPTNVHAQVMNPAATRNREYQVRRVAALRRELTRMRTGIERVISGLRDLGESIPEDTESANVIGRLDAIIETSTQEITEHANTGANNNSTRTQADLQTRIDDTRRRVNDARQTRDHAAAELETAEASFQDLQQDLQYLQREQRTMENYMRVFGTREEMLAQGENYESPIGGMFSRAMERFRAAEDVRRDERTLRQVLEDEARIDTNEAVSRRLEELESRERDVWGVPRSQQRSGLHHTSRGLRPALRYIGNRDNLATTVGNAADATTNEAFDRLATEVAGDIETDTPPVLSDTQEESVLQEYYSLIRQQDWTQPAGLEEGDTQHRNEANFPRNMLNAIVAARAREVADTTEQGQPGEVLEGQDINEASTPYFSEDEWWHQDVDIILRALTTDDELREEVNMTVHNAAVIQGYFIADLVSERDRMIIDEVLRSAAVIWRTGLPAQWLKRRSELVHAELVPEPGLFTGAGGNGGSPAWASHHNPYMRIEITAQAFMTSSEVRRSARTLTPPERLQMLYRLQSERRIPSDVTLLQEMTNDEATYSLVLAVYCRNLQRNDQPQAELVNASRREVARNGNHSRQDLDDRRRETANRAFALAAGRQAMQTGSQALIERAANAVVNSNANSDAPDDQEAGTRAAIRRLQPLMRHTRHDLTVPYRQLTLSDYLTSSPNSSRSSSPEPSRGLDARDSGRPDAKSDEELLVSMECKICYTQMAEVACLPCGHLVMCRWCSDQHSPCLNHDRTRPRRPTGCPVCRKTIRQKVRVFRV